MGDVKRYDLEQPDSHMGSAKMQREDYGDWFSFEDYTALRARLDAVEQIGLAFEVDAGEQRERAERAEAALATARRDAVQIKSDAINDFCAKAGIRMSVEVEALPDDVREFRRDSAIRALANEAET